MPSKKYDSTSMELRLAQFWAEQEVYHFDKESSAPIYSIDTPPPTVSGNLHLGHIYSYSHTDFIARFWRMNGYNVFYPMGFDDNGLPTERMVEKKLNLRANELDQKDFIDQCLRISTQVKADYRALWQRLGLSIDWRYTYSTIDELSRRTSQLSFIDLYHKGLVYRKESPAIWCPECGTAIAQADLNDLERRTEFVTLKFYLEDHRYIPIATTRPELLPACVAVFVNPRDERYHQFIGCEVSVPLFGQRVSVLMDEGVSPDKGTGAVMCCTFGDTVDVGWWQEHRLGLINAIDRQGHLTSAAQEFAGLSTLQARQAINQSLISKNLLIDRYPSDQTVRCTSGAIPR